MYLCDFPSVFKGGKLSCFPSATQPTHTYQTLGIQCAKSHLIYFKVLLDGWKAHVPGCPRPSQIDHTERKVFLPHLLSA